MNFKVGEKVIALKSGDSSVSQERVKGATYVITAISYCPVCGVQSLNVDNKPNSGGHPSVRCECGVTNNSGGRGWTYSRYFTRPISNEYKLEVSIPELLTIKEPQYQ